MISPAHDLRYAARSLRKSLGFTSLSILILTLGIGVTVTMFSIMHAVLWRALPYPNAERLVVVETVFGPVQDAGLAPAEVLYLRESSKTLNSLAMINGTDAFVSANGEMERATLAYAVSRRTQEFGIRLALGASTHQVMRLVATEGVALTALGAAIGIAGAVATAQLLSGLLYGVAPLDWVTFALVVAVIGLAALVSSAAPAMRAARVDPLVALRYE
jgi:hypothetical protein